MSNNRFLPLLGAVLATPALTAAFETAQAHDTDAHTQLTEPSANAISSQAAETLKVELLRLAPADKLALAGDRLGASPADAVGLARARAVLKSGGVELAERAAAPRTNTDIPECRGASADAKGAGASGAGAALRTNTNIPECLSPAASAKGAGASGSGASMRTNTDIPECQASAAKGSGASGAGAALRTNTNIPECLSPNASAKGARASGWGASMRTNTDIPECQAATAKGAGR